MSLHTIEVRNLRFPLGASIPKAWLAGKQSVTTFFDNLSVLFPQGERFFLNSVRVHEAQISDPTLLEDVKGFYQQEALHSPSELDCSALLARWQAEFEALPIYRENLKPTRLAVA